MNPLYMDDSYLKEFPATVKELNGNMAVLSETAFYPSGGGVPNDTGWLKHEGITLPVVNVTKQDGKIFHHLETSDLEVGRKVTGIIDWQRRYTLMRHHTAAHLLAAIMYNKLGILITGNQLDVEKSRMDFSMENFDRSIIEEVFREANAAIGEDRKVRIYYLTREEALKIPGVVKLANALPPSVDKLRIVEIDGIDVQADGGCHVASLKEIGRIEFLKAENKGKSNRRIYYTVS